MAAKRFHLERVFSDKPLSDMEWAVEGLQCPCIDSVRQLSVPRAANRLASRRRRATVGTDQCQRRIAARAHPHFGP